MTAKPMSCHRAPSTLPNTHISPPTQSAGRGGHCQSLEGFCRGFGRGLMCTGVLCPQEENFRSGKTDEVESLVCGQSVAEEGGC